MDSSDTLRKISSRRSGADAMEPIQSLATIDTKPEDRVTLDPPIRTDGDPSPPSEILISSLSMEFNTISTESVNTLS